VFSDHEDVAGITNEVEAADAGTVKRLQVGSNSRVVDEEVH
jgi:hypothetical protein